ncbi:MAG: serine/threonine-protein kinase, partial [Pyrinomonadaceae bacterium]
MAQKPIGIRRAPMNAEQYKKVMAVIDAVTDAEPDDRQHLLSNLCADDAELRTEVERLLKQNTAAGSFMEDRPRAIADEVSLIGQTIGNYRITDEIGRGGMGAVYLAERCDGAFDHQVAIKLIKRGMDSDALVRRFLNERRILATLEHPHIARLIDGGTTDDGSPYFIMEFVDGSPIDVYARERAMTVDDRLSLFALVCEAVEYAHTRQIIHRDIKPSNILVSEEGRPRLLDFGISKVVNAEDGGGSTVTETAWRLLTPEYASPEQILGNTVTSRTDVYSLGVLLCELLTGHGPYNFPSRSPLDLARTICEQEPQLPSTLAGRQDPKTSDARPEVDHTTNTKDLKRRLRGDLDRIVLTALQKDPELRYSSAAAFAADVRRHLNGQRILAPRPTLIQRFLSYFKTAVVGRWRPSFSLAAVLLVAAISFASAWWFFNRGTSAAPKVNSIAVLPFKYEGDGDPSIGPG